MRRRFRGRALSNRILASRVLPHARVHDDPARSRCIPCLRKCARHYVLHAFRTNCDHANRRTRRDDQDSYAGTRSVQNKRRRRPLRFASPDNHFDLARETKVRRAPLTQGLGQRGGLRAARARERRKARSLRTLFGRSGGKAGSPIVRQAWQSARCFSPFGAVERRVPRLRECAAIGSGNGCAQDAEL